MHPAWLCCESSEYAGYSCTFAPCQAGASTLKISGFILARTLNGEKLQTYNSEEDLKRIGKTTPVSSEGTIISCPTLVMIQKACQERDFINIDINFRVLKRKFHIDCEKKCRILGDLILMLGKKCHSRRRLNLNMPGKSEIAIIAVVINMFRLPDLLTGENITCDNLKLLQTRQPRVFFLLKKI
jgi:hypothetical protein